jgi:hypothetical protein
MPIPSQEAVRILDASGEQAQSMIDAYDRLRVDLVAASRQAGEARDAALRDLAGAYLPALDDESLARLTRLTGFRGFERRDPRTAMAREKVALERTITRIEADDRYVRRQYLVGPAGERTRALDEAKALLEPWEQECGRFESLPGFLELVEVGYDTPRFKESWWQPAYWRHWARGDAICQALGLGDFGDDVLPAYEKVAAERERWRQQVAFHQSKVDEIHELAKERDDAVARIPQLPEIYLAQAQGVLASFLASADLPLLEQWLEQQGEDKAIAMGLRRVAGLAAKAELLMTLKDEAVDTTIADLRGRASKFSRKAAKYRRPKNYGVAVPDRDVDRTFEARMAKLREREAQLRKLQDRMVGYDDYSSFDLQNDPSLWWIEMTRTRPPRQMRLRGWYERNPQSRVTHDAEVDDLHARAIAAARVAAGDDALDYVS